MADSFTCEAEYLKMSLWAKSQLLQGDALRQVQAVYGEHFFN